MMKFIAMFGWIFLIGSLALFASDWFPVSVSSEPFTSFSGTDDYARVVSGHDSEWELLAEMKLPALFTGLLMIVYAWYRGRSK
ncbi:hypothetical protein L4174_005625 [Photobacterium sp. CCB-ST2H9]|uniref:hypothetical protein n=1 Tax=unclassified Photobacterium TaxID=2628852 RepID=UPI002003A0C7|nr:hypothetical protein [Photobacterium sp. CCB-ST2H9]UTM58321.1 hypothetical protein L4174_005625 [Photobacterium sp. CCB-ST2H9]